MTRVEEIPQNISFSISISISLAIGDSLDHPHRIGIFLDQESRIRIITHVCIAISLCMNALEV